MYIYLVSYAYLLLNFEIKEICLIYNDLGLPFKKKRG